MNNALRDNGAHCLWNSIYGCHNDKLLHNDLTCCALTVLTALFSNLKVFHQRKAVEDGKCGSLTWFHMCHHQCLTPGLR